MNFQRRASTGSGVSPNPVEEQRKQPPTVRIHPIEFLPQSEELVPYRFRPRQKHQKIRPKTGCCSKARSDYVMLKTAFPTPSECSSPAEVLLKSFMEIIKKEQFWVEDLAADFEEQQSILAEDKDLTDVDKEKKAELLFEGEVEEEQDHERITVKEVYEVEERRWKLKSADFAEKIKVLIQCIALTRITYGDNSFDHAEALVNLAQAYLDWKCYYQQAANHCRTAKTILTNLAALEVVQTNEAIYTLVRLTLCRLYLVEGKAVIGLKSLDEAEKTLEKAQKLLDLIKKLPTISEAHIAWFERRISSTFASLYISQQRFGQATSSLQSALNIEQKKLVALAPVEPKEASLPEKSLLQYYSTTKRIVELHQQLGQVELMRGASADHTVAIKCYKSAIDAISNALALKGVEDPQQQNKTRVDDLREYFKLKSVKCYLQMSNCQRAAKQLEMAEGSLKKVLSMFEDASNKQFIKGGKKSKMYHIIVDELAKIFIKSQKHDDAITLLIDNLPSKRAQFGDYSIRVLETYNLLVSLYLFDGNIQEAVSYLKKYMAVSVVRYGPTDARTRNADITIKMLLAGQQDKSNEKKPLTFKVQ